MPLSFRHSPSGEYYYLFLHDAFLIATAERLKKQSVPNKQKASGKARGLQQQGVHPPSDAGLDRQF
jgi:hypothetical protein